MSTTSAIVATGYGGPEVLSLVEVPVPAPQGGEVSIDVRAAGVNPFDHKRYSGTFGSDPAALPMRLGGEVAGVVRALGGAGAVEGAAGALTVGDEVMAYPVGGGYAGEVVAKAANVVPKPSTLSFEHAAGLLLVGATAVHALTAAGVGEGDTVVLHGAAGGVGLIAVQLARLRGARVLATAGEDSHELLRELGAEPVRYGPGLLERLRELAPGGVDAAIDAVGSDEALDTSLALVADRQRIVTLVGRPQAADAGIRMIGAGPGGDPGTEIRAAAKLELWRLAERGKLRVVLAARYPLADAADAHRLLLEGHTHGKVVLIP